MFLAQLQNGQEALSSYRTGIDILSATLVGSLMHLSYPSQLTCLLVSQSSAEEEQGEQGRGNAATTVKTQIAKAHCAIAELYLTDLW